MRNLDANMIAELQKLEFYEFWLVEFGFAVPCRLTDFDRPIYHNANRFSPDAIRVDDINVSSTFSVDSVTLSVGNASAAFGALILGEDVRFKPLKVYIGVLKDLYTPIVHLVFDGFLAEYDLEEDEAQIQAVNEFFLWNKRTLRIAQPSCPWVFKGPGGECGYAGASAWCDQSYARCLALGNDLNFGGNRWVVDTAEKQVWWGRLPK